MTAVGWSAERRVRAHAVEQGTGRATWDVTGTTTWAELDRRTDAVAAAVRAAGADPGTVAAMLAGPAADAIAALLGVLRAGAIAAPIPDGLPGPEIQVSLQVLSPALVLHDEALGPALARAPGARLSIEAALGGPPHPGGPPHRGGQSGQGIVGALDHAPEPEAPAVIVLTSGTTGRPKGVILSHRALASSADSWLAALPPATGWLLALGLGHVAGLGVVWRAIAGGVPVRIVGRGDPAAILAALADDPAPSHVSLVPAQLSRLLDRTRDAAPPPTLRAVLLGGGPIPPPLVTRAIRAGWPVVPTYGLSETASGATALPTGEALAHPGSAGRALPGVSVRIEAADDEGVGEIVVETEARFTAYVGGPSAPATQPVLTGDLGRLDQSGRLFVVDRRLDRIVRGGENIAPAEVEAVLLGHPSVADAAVVGRPDPLWGHVPVAAVVLSDGAGDPGDDALAAHVRAALAGFKVPAAFVRLDALPRAAGGKLRRGAVRALVAGEPEGELARPGGDAIGWLVTGTGSTPLVLLHGTLSTGAQLSRLAAALAEPGALTVHALDRRGSGTGRLVRVRPLDVSVHVADVIAYLDARAIDRAAFVGVSFGGVVALEVAARHPDRVLAVVAYEPPYGAVGDADARAWFEELARTVSAAHRSGGSPAAAESFMRAVAGDAAWDRLPERARVFLESQGDGALADAGLTGLDPAALARIRVPVTILTGSASEPFYAPIADTLVARITGARRVVLDGLDHPAPITQPVRVGAAVFAALASAGEAGQRPDPAPEIPNHHDARGNHGDAAPRHPHATPERPA